MPFGRLRQRPSNLAVQLTTKPCIVAIDFLARRPIGGLVGRQAAPHRINTKSEKLVERFMKPAQSESAVRQQIPVKGLYVSGIEHDAMAFGEGPVVYGLVANDLEDLVGTLASVIQARLQVVADADSAA